MRDPGHVVHDLLFGTVILVLVGAVVLAFFGGLSLIFHDNYGWGVPLFASSVCFLCWLLGSVISDHWNGHL